MNSSIPDERPRRKVRASRLGLLFALGLSALPGRLEAAETSTISALNPAARLFRVDPQNPLGLAETALTGGQYSQVIEIIKTYHGPLPDLAAWQSAQALSALGQNDQALAAIRGLPKRVLGCAPVEEDPLTIRPTERAAELLAGSQPQAAAELLLSLPADGARFGLARTLLMRAQNPAALKALEIRMLTEAPEAPESLALARQLGTSGIEARLDAVAWRLRLTRLLEANANEPARDEATLLLAGLDAADEGRCELSYVLGKSQRKLRSYRTAIKALEDARTGCPAGSEWALRAALLELQVRAIRGQVRASKPTLQWILSKYPEHSYADDALYTYAEVAERSGQLKVATPLYQQILDKYPNGDQAMAAAWRLAYLAIEAEQAATADKHLRFILEGHPPRAVDREQARYWLAQLLTKTKPAESDALYLGLTDTPTFYTWLAIDRLGRSKPALAEAMKQKLLAATRTAPVDLALSPQITGDPRFVRAQALAAAGQMELAAAELEPLRCGTLNDQALLTLALAFDAVGAFPRAQALLRSRASLLAQTFSPAALPVWQAAYSRPYAEEITKAAQTEKLEPLLLHALVREESTFDPDIVSWAGATGLAQLMPATAIGAYATVFRGRLDLSRLTEPELNLRLGAHVLRLGMKSFDQVEPLALGAYNGGAGMVERFLPKEPVPFDRWIEGFGVRETRRYMQRVTETWGLYRLLYDRQRPWIGFPETVAPKTASRD